MQHVARADGQNFQSQSQGQTKAPTATSATGALEGVASLALTRFCLLQEMNKEKESKRCFGMLTI